MWTGRVVLALVVLAILGVLGGYFWLQNYLRSDRFREMVNARVSEKLEVDAAFEKFVWDGMELRAPEFGATGEKMIRRIDLEGLETEIKFAPLLRKKMETQEVRVRRLHLEIDVTRDGPQFEEGGKSAFSFTNARIDEMSGEVDFGTTALRWEGIKGIISPGHAKGTYDATLSRGRLLTPLALFPVLELQDADLRFADKALFVRSGDWHVFKSGRLATDGEIDFRSGRYIFNGELTRVQCEEVIPEDWSKRLTGELSSHFTVESAGKKPPVVSGSLELARGHLTALPILDRIAAYTATERFRRLGLRKATLEYRQQGERLELTKIVIASEGLLRIEGWLTIDAGRLEGEFQLGLTPNTLALIPGAAHRVFISGRNGMHWTPVKITGTTKFPREDLSDRLIAAGFEWMYELVDGQLVLKHSGKVAGEVAKSLWETGGQAARIGIDIVGQGADLLNHVPLPIGPIRDGVGSVIEGILGIPRRQDEDVAPPKPKTPDEILKEEEKKALDQEKDLEEKDLEKKTEDKVDGSEAEQEGSSFPARAQKVIEKALELENP